MRNFIARYISIQFIFFHQSQYEYLFLYKPLGRSRTKKNKFDILPKYNSEKKDENR
jgi:uncharacterized protein with von Willebrand factor type A (vWA) domain